MSITVYSFSRLESFHTCPLAFYYTYIAEDRDRGSDNVYSILGSKVHEILEQLQQRSIDNSKAIELFNGACEEADLLDYRFLSDNIANNYKESVLHYLENYKPIDCKDFLIEEEFEIGIDGIKIRGFIDLTVIYEGGTAEIIDYKTSSKFSKKKDLPKKTRQLILYAYALEQLHPELKVKKVKFDMLKYAKNKRGTLKLRAEIDIFEDPEDFEIAYVEAEYTEEAKQDLINYIKNTVNEIESLDPTDELAWSPSKTCGDFFCGNICGQRDKCVFK